MNFYRGQSIRVRTRKPLGDFVFGLLGSLYAIVSFVVVAAVAVLVIWALILLITFLRLRIAQLRATETAGS